MNEVVEYGSDLLRHVKREKLSTEEIGHVIAYQAKVIHEVAMELIEEGRTEKKIGKVKEGVKTLGMSSRLFSESAKILVRYEPPPELLAQAREALIEKAIKGGYEIAFEADGRVVMERYGVASGARYMEESV